MNKKVLIAGVGLAVAMGVGAASAAPELKHVNGLLVLPNAKIVNKPMAVSTPKTSQTNLRTFTGTGGTGVESEPTRDEIDALASQSAAMRSQDRAKSTVTPVAARTADGRIEGVRISELEDDGDLSPFSVVRREADGSLRYMCVQGRVNAEKFIVAKAKGSRNDR
jgi:hypothetical protein